MGFKAGSGGRAWLPGDPGESAELWRLGCPDGHEERFVDFFDRRHLPRCGVCGKRMMLLPDVSFADRLKAKAPPERKELIDELLADSEES